MIITETTKDLSCLKEIDFIKQRYLLINLDKSNSLTEKQTNDIKKCDELIMLFSTIEKQQNLFNQYKDVFPNLNFGFIHYLNSDSVKSILRNKGEGFIIQLINNRVTTIPNKILNYENKG